MIKSSVIHREFQFYCSLKLLVILDGMYVCCKLYGCQYFGHPPEVTQNVSLLAIAPTRTQNSAELTICRQIESCVLDGAAKDLEP